MLFQADCIISDDESSSIVDSLEKSLVPFLHLFRLVFDNIGKPLQSLGKFFRPKRSTPTTSSSLAVGGGDLDHQTGGVTHYSPTQVLKNLNEITHRAANWGLMMGVLLKWRADFRSKPHNL